MRPAALRPPCPPLSMFLLAPGSGKKPSVDPDCTYRTKGSSAMRQVSFNARFLSRN